MNAIFIDPVVAMLHNKKTDRWHPILFIGAPLPGGAGPMRHKSKGHHTAGFDTREAAEQNARELGQQVHGSRLLLDPPLEWDELDMPAMVQLLPERSSDRLPTDRSSDNQTGAK